MLVLSGITRGAEVRAEIEMIDKTLFGMFKPRSFVGKKSAEANHVRRYEEICAAIAQATGRDPKRMTTREFFYTLDLLKKQAKRHGQPNQGKRSIPG
jgi:hypothetical protein